jgi:hypothetical protein
MGNSVLEGAGDTEVREAELQPVIKPVMPHVAAMRNERRESEVFE